MILLFSFVSESIPICKKGRNFNLRIIKCIYIYIMCIVIKRVDNILFIFNTNNNGYKSKIDIAF